MTRIDPTTRWRILFKAPQDRRWVAVGSLGTRDQAEQWLVRFSGTGDYRIVNPTSYDMKGGTRAGN